MAVVKVEFIVDTAASAEVYIVGSTNSLGKWDATKAQKLNKVGDTKFSITKMLTPGEIVEYKFLSAKSWDNVEHDAYGNDVANHCLSPVKGLVEHIEVIKF